MKTEIKNEAKLKPYELGVEKRFNNYIWMLAFSIISISIAFLALTLTYLFSKNLDTNTVSLHIPFIFYIDTVVLVVGSIALYMATQSFKKDQINRHKMSLYIALLSGFSFLIGQIGGWMALANTGFGITENKSGSFLYVISGIHAIHIIGGILFLIVIFIDASKRLQESALSVVYFTDPLPKERLRLANYYWHFLGALWIYILLFFSIVR